MSVNIPGFTHSADFTCAVCFESLRNCVVFGCGHWLCATCSPLVKVCPECRRPVKSRARIHQMAGLADAYGYTCDACGAICGTNDRMAHHCQPGAAAAAAYDGPGLPADTAPPVPAAAAAPAPPPVAATAHYEPAEGTSKAALLTLAREGATVHTAIYSNCGAVVDDDVVRATAEHCPGLQELHVDDTAVTDVGVGAIAERCPGLQVLYVRNTAVADVGLRAIAEHCRGLKVLHVGGTAVTDVGVGAIAEHCPDLDGLYASDTALTDVGLCAIAEHCRELFLSPCRRHRRHGRRRRRLRRALPPGSG
jgi:hypothetical protein